MFKKILAILLVAVMACASFASCTGTNTKRLGESADVLPREEVKPTLTNVPDDFKIGLICLHDENSTYDYNFIKAMNSVKEALKLKDEQLLVATGIAEDEACYNKAIEFVNAGCKVIFADSFGHEEHIAKAAKEHPEVQFCHATGVSAHVLGLDNFQNAFASIYEGRYIAGIVAGMKLNEMIADGKITAEQAVIGYVGAFTYAEVISGMTSFYLGAKSICPSVTMKVKYTGSWYDQTKELEAAKALIEDEKCVLISQHADSLGAPSQCQKAGVPNVSYNGSTYNAGKDTFLISSAINWAPYFLHIIECTVNGTDIEADYTGSILTNSVVLSGLNEDVIAEGTREKVDAAIAALKAGTLHVFDVNTFTVTVDAENNVNANATVDENGHLTAYLADTDGDFAGDTNVIHDGYFDESGKDFRSAPYFDIIIDGITNLDTVY